jgi:hypothetical protein
MVAVLASSIAFLLPSKWLPRYWGGSFLRGRSVIFGLIFGTASVHLRKTMPMAERWKKETRKRGGRPRFLLMPELLDTLIIAMT